MKARLGVEQLEDRIVATVDPGVPVDITQPTPPPVAIMQVPREFWGNFVLLEDTSVQYIQTKILADGSLETIRINYGTLSSIQAQVAANAQAWKYQMLYFGQLAKQSEPNWTALQAAIAELNATFGSSVTTTKETVAAGGAGAGAVGTIVGWSNILPGVGFGLTVGAIGAYCLSEADAYWSSLPEGHRPALPPSAYASMTN